ncbi:flavin reductase family protein [Streptomyces albipurpureus]|uniref:Flavin reductase family protein n=1 Tax=Streptomyces albipurpureus TaxID=2897419 RepID=A0ABT0UIC1_9ACTN|nr:flavin reductase family protein [Streptomyces sp. CWNU-1]MCM2388377.1 flavin reductase family protein [Streptomyces sp. CWNU-1]
MGRNRGVHPARDARRGPDRGAQGGPRRGRGQRDEVGEPPCASPSPPFIRAARHSAINVLTADQEALSGCSLEGARTGSTAFDGAEDTTAPPLLDSALAHIDCAFHRRIVGDHFIVVGRVSSWAQSNDTLPLPTSRARFAPSSGETTRASTSARVGLHFWAAFRLGRNSVAPGTDVG